MKASEASSYHLSKVQQAIIRDEMRTLEDICDKNIQGSSVLDYANSINPMLFQEILEAFRKECPLVYDVVESLVISNPRSRNILKTNSHKILCGLQTLGFISNIRNSKTIVMLQSMPSLSLRWNTM